MNSHWIAWLSSIIAVTLTIILAFANGARLAWKGMRSMRSSVPVSPPEAVLLWKDDPRQELLREPLITFTLLAHNLLLVLLAALCLGSAARGWQSLPELYI